MSHTTNAFVLGSMAASVGSRSSTMDGGGVRSIPPLPCTCLSVMNRCPCCARDDRKDEHNPPKRPQFAFIRMRLRIRSAAAEVAAIVNIRDASKKKPPPTKKLQKIVVTQSPETRSPRTQFSKSVSLPTSSRVCLTVKPSQMLRHCPPSQNDKKW